MNERSGNFPDKSGFALPLDRRGRGLMVPGSSDIVPFVPLQAPPGETSFDVNELLRTIYKWRWLIAGITLTSVLAAIILSLLVTPEYRAAVTLEINREPTRILDDKSDVEPSQSNDADFVGTQIGLLKSRSLTERVARALNLAGNAEVVDLEQPRAERARAAGAVLRSNLNVEPQRGTRLVTVSFDSTDPALAARVANSYADNFIEGNLERRYEANSYARDFLQKRLAAVKATLEQTERQLVDYATRQGILQLSQGTGADGGQSETSLDAASLVQLNEALSQARGDRITAEQRYRNAQGAMATSGTLTNPTVQALTSQRAQLQATYQQKLSTFQPEYPEMQALKAQIDALSRSIASESRTVSGSVSSTLRADYAAAVARENALQSRVNGLKGSVMDLRRRSIQYTILQREVDTNRSQYEALLDRYKTIAVAGGVGTNLVSIVDRAEPPGAPFKPNLPLNVALGLLAGLLLGFGAAFAIEFIDDTIKTPDDLTNKLKLSPLGVIPKAPKDSSLIEVLGDPRAPTTEAYHSVRTALQFASDHGVPKSLLVTSTRAGEGKSTTSMALAQNFARLGASVLLIDADLRKPSFRAPPSVVEGLSNLLAGSDAIRECIHKTSFDRLFLLPSGPIPPNPAELLSTDRFRKILEEVIAWFDYVVVDAPPVLGLADAPLLSSVCEGTLMVFEASKVRRGIALNAVNRLRGADAKLIGGILTKYNAKTSGYGYGYAYADESYTYGVGEERQRQIELIS